MTGQLSVQQCRGPTILPSQRLDVRAFADVAVVAGVLVFGRSVPLVIAAIAAALWDE
jgi:hypothetical protein